jgi:DNA polymerase-4
VTAKKLRAIGIQKLVDVRAIDDISLQRTVGSLAAWLKRLSHGDDPREVKPDRPWKSISAETTYPEDLTSLAEMRAEVARLSLRVANSLEKKKLNARTVTLKLRYSDFTTVTRSHSAEPTRAADAFASRAAALLERTDAARRPVRLLGVGAHGLEEAQSGRPEQLRLE